MLRSPRRGYLKSISLCPRMTRGVSRASGLKYKASISDSSKPIIWAYYLLNSRQFRSVKGFREEVRRCAAASQKQRRSIARYTGLRSRQNDCQLCVTSVSIQRKRHRVEILDQSFWIVSVGYIGTMGRKKSRLKKFLTEHPFCCLCGGTVPADSIEHAPPKIMFTKSHRPKGLEVPACSRCNNGSADQDQAVAFFCLMQAAALFTDDDGSTTEFAALEKIVKAVKNNYPDLLTAFKFVGKQKFLVSGESQSLSRFEIKDEVFGQYLEPWAAKQILSYWYDQTGKCASSKAVVLVRWTTLHEMSNSEDLVKYAHSFAAFGSLKQGAWDTTEQFFVKSSLNAEENLGAMFFAYHSSVSFYAALIDNPSVDMTKFLASNTQFACLTTNPETGITHE